MANKSRQTRSDPELGRNEPCGCGSGLLYRNCHAKTSARYYVRGDEIYQRVPLSKKVAEQLRKQTEDFKLVFGREPDEGDPIMYSRLSVGADDQFFRDVQRIAEKAGIPEHLAYATRKTERFVADVNLHLLSEGQKRDWENATAEYYRLKRRGYNPFYRFTILGPRQYESYLRLSKCLQEVAYVFDVSINHAVNSGENIATHPDHSFVLSTIANTAVSLISISKILDSHFSDDVIAISRGFFEDYLRIKCLRVGSVEGDALIAAQMAARGYVEYAKRPNGKLNFDKVRWDDAPDKIIDVANAKSYSKLSQLTGDPADGLLYELMYKEMSSYVHRDVIKVLASLYQSGSIPLPDENDKVVAVYYVSFILQVYLEELVSHNWLGSRIIGDLIFKAREISKLLAHLSASKRLMARVPLRYR